MAQQLVDTGRVFLNFVTDLFMINTLIKFVFYYLWMMQMMQGYDDRMIVYNRIGK